MQESNLVSSPVKVFFLKTEVEKVVKEIHDDRCSDQEKQSDLFPLFL